MSRISVAFDVSANCVILVPPNASIAAVASVVVGLICKKSFCLSITPCKSVSNSSFGQGGGVFLMRIVGLGEVHGLDIMVIKHKVHWKSTQCLATMDKVRSQTFLKVFKAEAEIMTMTMTVLY